MKALWIALCLFVTGAAFADPADCLMPTAENSTLSFQLHERMIDYHQYDFVIHLMEDWDLPEGSMPQNDYETSNWVSGDFTYDVNDYFPNRASNARGSYLFVERVEDDGMNSIWDLRIVHYVDGEPGQYEVFSGRAHCLDE